MSPPEQSNAPSTDPEQASPPGTESHAAPVTMSDPSTEAVTELKDSTTLDTNSDPKPLEVPSATKDSVAGDDQSEIKLSASEEVFPDRAASESKGKGKEVDTTPVLGEAPDLTASTATLKPSKADDIDAAPTQYLTAELSNYVDPTPPTPTASQPPSRSPSTAARSHHSNDESPSEQEADPDEKKYLSDDEHEGGSRLEIQSIMDQFSESGGGPGAEEVMSPRLEIASPMLSSPPIQHPPRKSSLEPLSASVTAQMAELKMTPSHGSGPPEAPALSEQAPPVPPKDGTFGTPPRTREERTGSIESPSVASMSMSIHRPPPPEPEPEPALPFDFHRFLEQLRNKKADPVARYLKSFLSEFGKKQWMVHEQVKIISDFLAFIANKMMQCEVWRDVSDAEFDNAREGMEKLVMNRLYSQTFSPAIPPPKPVPGAKPRRKGGDVPLGPGRKGQHQEDVERDDIVQQKINIYGWIREEHLDMPPIGDSGKRFLRLAQQELLKIKSYRAPRDKIICVLNCCKVIFGLLKHNKSDSSADSFMPLLIYVVLQSNPDHLVSNVQYILRFRNQEKLGGEAGYYLSSLMGAVQFIENLDRTTLTIFDDEFEKNVEAAVSAIAEKHQAASPSPSQPATFSEKAGSGLHAPVPPKRPSMDGAGDSSSNPGRRSTSSNEPDPNDEKAAIGSLLRTIQKPLSTIGRIFSEEGTSAGEQPPLHLDDSDHNHRPSSRHNLSAEEAAARQASAEAAEAQKLQRAEHANVVETLAGMFPDLDKDIISDVVYQKQGRVGLAVDACLALST
ncbi:hypothetical protein NLU13_2163 [Sarocladium strictum]|uniref:Vacuolar protein sorting-associated protein 9a n=1 Tax=Sarocladium strictum TaxID=5046 RepID=A0AA39GTU8_SARSR|nr:hypothetical protein NLU13_2163 [Sarocladium strictum]